MGEKDDFWVTPKRRISDTPKNLTTDDKIDIFFERIKGWKLDIADELANGRLLRSGETEVFIEPNPHAKFAIMDIITSYFEMIGKYQSGYTGKNKSQNYFEKGFYSVFSEEIDAIKNDKIKQLLRLQIRKIYSDIRCGLYHNSLPKSGIFLTDNESPVIKFWQFRMDINPQRLVKLILRHFEDYIEQLQNPNNLVLRQNFEKRFDKDNYAVK